MPSAPTLSKEEKASEKFRKAMKQILSVSKRELERRELQWKNGRKEHKSHKRHR